MSDTIRTDDPAFLLLCRKAAAFDAIANGRIAIYRNGTNYEQWIAQPQEVGGWPRGDWIVNTSLLDAIEAALSTDRQTPKQTFGEVAE